jgi:hypothetical protein
MSGAAQAALHDRGGGLIYDDVLNVTWLQDANYAETSGYDVDGRMTWNQAMTWANQLVYGGFDDWRLPTVEPVNGVDFNPDYTFDGTTDTSYNITSPNSEMGYMFHVNLGNSSYYTPTGAISGCYISYPADTCLDNTGQFVNFELYGYWSGTEYAPPPADLGGSGVIQTGGDPQPSSEIPSAWMFYMTAGNQYSLHKDFELQAWAVRDGDVAAVPEADTWAMLLAGLGLIGVATRRRKLAKI